MSREAFKELCALMREPHEKWGHVLERVAKSFGYKDWNTMSALYPWKED